MTRDEIENEIKPNEQKVALQIRQRQIEKEFFKKKFEWQNEEDMIKVHWFFGTGGKGKTAYVQKVLLANEFEKTATIDFDDRGNAKVDFYDDEREVENIVFNEL